MHFLKHRQNFTTFSLLSQYGLALRGDLRTMDEIKPMMMLIKTWVTNTSLLKHKQNLPQYY